MKLLVASIFLFLGSILSAQDVVTMVNGQKISGVISAETSSSVIVEMQGLKLTLKRNDIATIDRMGSQARQDAIKEIRSPRPHQEAFYPESARPQFHAFTRLGILLSKWT